MPSQSPPLSAHFPSPQPDVQPAHETEAARELLRAIVEHELRSVPNQHPFVPPSNSTSYHRLPTIRLGVDGLSVVRANEHGEADLAITGSVNDQESTGRDPSLPPPAAPGHLPHGRPGYVPRSALTTISERSSPTDPSPRQTGYLSDSVETDADTLLEEDAEPKITPTPRAVMSTGWARTRAVEWDLPDPAADGFGGSPRLRRRTLRHATDESIRTVRQRSSSQELARTPVTEEYALRVLPDGGVHNAVQAPARGGAEIGQRYTSALVDSPERMPAAAPVNSDHPPQANPPLGGTTPSVAPPPYFGSVPSQTTPRWVPYTPYLQLPPVLPASVPPMQSPPYAQIQQPPYSGPPVPYPFMLPYMHNANWSQAELYNDMTAAAGLGMATPLQARYPSLPRPPTGQHQHQYYHQERLAAPRRGVVPLPSRTSTRSVIGDILDTMGTPHAVSECVVDPRDIERSPHGGRHAVQLSAGEWRPTWTLFPLRAFRGREYKVVDVENTWDDERLLLALNDAYKELRVWYKRWFSLMGLSYITRVRVNDAFIYPQRVGPGRTTAHRNLRLRYLLAHPEHMRGKREFVRVLTESAEFGVEFVERWRMRYVVAIVIGSALLSLAIALTYAMRTLDWATGFTIASFFSQTFAEVFVLLGCLQYYEF